MASPPATQPGQASYQAAPPALPAGYPGQAGNPQAPPLPGRTPGSMLAQQPGVVGRSAPPSHALTSPRAYPPSLPAAPQALPGPAPGYGGAGQASQRSTAQFPALGQPALGQGNGRSSEVYVPQQGQQLPVPHAALPAVAGVSLADAVQAAHGEGFAFGRAVARDAPALWLEAVLARKPRMPSDLEARLLQESSLPIDSLLHDEVRHALRRGFWDALERSRA